MAKLNVASVEEASLECVRTGNGGGPWAAERDGRGEEERAASWSVEEETPRPVPDAASGSVEGGTAFSEGIPTGTSAVEGAVGATLASVEPRWSSATFFFRSSLRIPGTAIVLRPYAVMAPVPAAPYPPA